MKQIVAFLGNPGRQYENTRHNLPWLVIRHFTFGGTLRWQKRFKGEYTDHQVSGRKIYFHKPLGFMNKSGESVAAIATFYKVPPEEIVVIHDEVELPFGELGIKFGGGLAGHNGLRSVSAHLGTRDFYRIRIGAGRPAKGSVSSHVLGKLDAAELDELEELSGRTESLLLSLLEDTGHPSPLIGRHR